MLTLPQGITGFDAPICVDIRRFRTDLYAAARLEKIAVSVSPPDAPDGVLSFVAASLMSGESQVSVMLNIYAPWLAFAYHSDSGNATPDFTDVPRLARHFSQYNIPGASFLTATPTGDCLSALSDVEVKQVGYWKPARIGDIVYNAWD